MSRKCDIPARVGITSARREYSNPPRAGNTDVSSFKKKKRNLLMTCHALNLLKYMIEMVLISFISFHLYAACIHNQKHYRPLQSIVEAIETYYKGHNT